MSPLGKIRNEKDLSMAVFGGSGTRKERNSERNRADYTSTTSLGRLGASGNR